VFPDAAVRPARREDVAAHPVFSIWSGSSALLRPSTDQLRGDDYGVPEVVGEAAPQAAAAGAPHPHFPVPDDGTTSSPKVATAIFGTPTASPST
jgi:hypothetical protein